MSTTTLVLLGVCAVIYGLDKSLIPGAGILAVALLTGAMPAKEATGLLLVLAIVADWSAIWVYRHDVVVRSLLRLLPSVIIGVIAGAVFLFFADNQGTRLTIGVILAVFISMYFISQIVARARSHHREQDNLQSAAAVTIQQAQPVDRHEDSGLWPTLVHWAKHIVMGALAGFTTMVANVGGPVTAVYFTSEKLPVTKFLGTTAWFYLIVNMIKLPFSIGLGMITMSGITSVLWTIPLVVVSVICGRILAKRLRQSIFTLIVYLFAVIAVVQLFL